jgi:hypothetical protein
LKVGLSSDKAYAGISGSTAYQMKAAAAQPFNSQAAFSAMDDDERPGVVMTSQARAALMAKLARDEDGLKEPVAPAAVPAAYVFIPIVFFLLFLTGLFFLGGF